MENCDWQDCKRMGIYELDGKHYCSKHYSDALIEAQKKRLAGRAGMGAVTVVINDGAGI